MIEYSRKSWWRVTLSLHGTVLPNVLGRVGLLTGFSLALCVLNDRVLEHYGYALPALDQLGHTVLGVALGMLISSRTTASINRYWEGRQCWGAIVNASRNLARLGAMYAPPAEELAGLISAYCILVRDNLRRSSRSAPASQSDPRLNSPNAPRWNGAGWAGEIEKFVSLPVAERVLAAASPPTMLAKSISAWINARRRAGALDSIQAMTLEGELNRLVDNQGGCERIQKTPLPFVYAALIKQVLMLYLFTLPLVLVAKMGFAAPLVVAVVALGMLGIEEAGVEVEDPFGTEPNSLPLEDICATIARDAQALATPERGA